MRSFPVHRELRRGVFRPAGLKPRTGGLKGAGRPAAASASQNPRSFPGPVGILQRHWPASPTKCCGDWVGETSVLPRRMLRLFGTPNWVGVVTPRHRALDQSVISVWVYHISYGSFAILSPPAIGDKLILSTRVASWKHQGLRRCSCALCDVEECPVAALAGCFRTCSDHHPFPYRVPF